MLAMNRVRSLILLVALASAAVARGDEAASERSRTASGVGRSSAAVGLTY
jgi:hypothetical protein